MARELTSTQQANVEAGGTRPIYLVEWQHSGGMEYLSCSGDVTYDSQAYTAGGITITGIDDSKTATLVLPATSTRISEVARNTWRGGICKITAIPAAPGDTPTYSAADGLLVLDGVIETTTFSGELISITAKSKYYVGALVPRFSFDDVTSIIPAVGATSTWEGEDYSYEQWLKTTAAIQRIVRPGVNPQVTGRASTSQVNTFSAGEQTGYKLLTAQGVDIPIVYGRASVPGFIFADGEYSGSKFIGVAWCMGEVFAVEKVFINDVEIPSTVTAKHYRGTTTQTVSPALQLYTAMSPAFSDDMVLRTPAGDVGIVYSVFNIPTSAISGAPRFRAIIQGRIVEDPTSTATDPYESYTEFSYDFLTGVTDSSPNGYTLTLNGDAGLSSPSIGLELDGTGDYATIPDGTAIGSSPFSLEVEFIANTALSSPETTETLICHGATASPLNRSLQIDRVGDDLLLYLSSDGSTWDIANGLSCGSITGGGSPEVIGRLLVERVDNQISTYLEGGTQSGVVTTAALYDSGDAWEIGACGGAQAWSGVIRSVRLTIGAYRYGSPHAITNTPFSDSGNYTAGKIYSEKPALCWNDLAKDPVNGLAATTTNVQTAMEYGDSALESGAPRCRIGLVINSPRLVEQWLDVLAMYANCLWFPEGADLKIIPDKIKDGTNGSGKELYSPASPEVFGSPLPTVVTEDGVSYSISIEITAEATTSPLTGVSVNFAGVEVIAVQTAAGTYGGTAIASGTSNTIEVVEEGGFDGTWANLSVKRTHRLIDKWMPSTLSVTGLPEGDKPNSVLVKYTEPDDATGAWKQKSFGVMNYMAAAGDPIVLTTLDLPGVYRTEEASNKAIAKLYREHRKTRISLTSTDEEVVCQPGDTINPVSSYRGIDAPVWVESCRMVSYGRYQITGTIYRDEQFPDTDYTDEDDVGTLGGGGYPEVIPQPPLACQPYSCSAYLDYLETLGVPVAQAFTTAPGDPLDFPFSTGGADGKYRYIYNIVASGTLQDDWSGSNPATSVLTPSTANLITLDAPDFCGGTIQKIACIDASKTTGSDSILFPSGAADWGDYYVQALIVGHNFSSTMSGSILLNTGKVWHYTYGSGATTSEPGTNIAISTSGNDVTITTTITSLYVIPVSTQSFTVIGAANKLHLINASVSSTTLYLYTNPSNAAHKLVCRDVTLSVSYAGSSITHTAPQVCGNGSSAGYSLTGVYAVAHSGVSYPRPMSNVKLSLASLVMGLDPPVDLEETSTVALERNKTDYDIPGWCFT